MGISPVLSSRLPANGDVLKFIAAACLKLCDQVEDKKLDLTCKTSAKKTKTKTSYEKWCDTISDDCDSDVITPQNKMDKLEEKA